MGALGTLATYLIIIVKTPWTLHTTVSDLKSLCVQPRYARLCAEGAPSGEPQTSLQLGGKMHT